MSNHSFLPFNHSQLDCPVFTDQELYLINQFNVWIEGVTQTCVAIPGFLGNVFFCYVLTRKELLSSFNLLLVALSIFDSCYIIGAMLESIRKQEIFDMSTSLHVHLFPYLLYPGSNIAMTASIFMIVAITFERYIAVHNPLDYNQAMNDGCLRRLLKYLLPVVIASVLFNIPKFLESRVSYVRTTEMDNGINITTAYVDVTSFRTNRHYQTYLNWSQSLVLGFIPVALLIYFNGRIYQDIRERERRKRPKKPDPVKIGTNKNGLSTTKQGKKGEQENTEMEHINPKDTKKQIESQPPNADENELAGKDNCFTSLENTASANPTSLEVPNKSFEITINGETSQTSNSETVEFTQKKLMSNTNTVKGNTQKSASMVTVKDNGKTGKKQKKLITTEITHNKSTSATSPTNPNQVQTKSNNARRRKAEDKMAMIFIAIVTGWLVTNFPRICLNFQEVLNVEHMHACMDTYPNSPFPPFPPWTLMLDPFSHLLLVINSAMNILFYGIFNQKFREVSKKEFTRCFPKAAARLSPSKSKRVIVLPKQNPTSNQNNKENHHVTEITQLRNNSSKCEELIPLTSTTHLVNSSFDAENSISQCKEPVQSTLIVSVVNSNISVATSNNKLLTDSSTQIPNSEYATTNLKKISAITTNTKEQGNNDKNGTLDKVGSNGNSIKSASSISKKTSSVNEECMNIEKGIVEKMDLDCIAKHPSSSFHCNEGEDGQDKNGGLSIKEAPLHNDEKTKNKIIQKRDTPQIYV